jgi:hypothetical protein
MAEANLTVPHYEPIEILELQITLTALQNEFLMRYVSNPGNIGLMREIMQTAFESLGNLQQLAGTMCPSPWDHTDTCKCRTMVLAAVEGAGDSEQLRDLRDLLKLLRAVREMKS